MNVNNIYSSPPYISPEVAATNKGILNPEEIDPRTGLPIGHIFGSVGTLNDIIVKSKLKAKNPSTDNNKKYFIIGGTAVLLLLLLGGTKRYRKSKKQF